MVKKFLRVSCLACSVLLYTLRANAQTTAAVFLSPASTESFPSITANLDVRDAQGNFLSGLEAAAVSIVEDGIVIAASSLTAVETNLQFVLAVNTANSFAIVDEQGSTRYTYAIEAFRSWASAAGATNNDDLSLATPAGVRSLHESDPLKWMSDLEQYQPAFQTAAPSMASLEKAIEIASEPGSDLGASRVVLWLTPALGPSFNADMLNAAEQARQLGVRVFVWMIDSKTLFQSEQAATLRALASQTGGNHFAFSGIEAFPDLGEELQGVRRAYKLGFRSQASSAGQHEIFAVVQDGEARINSDRQTYNLELSAPSIEITELPQSISRQLADRSDPSLPFEPTHQEISFKITFPDSIQREMVQSTLLVDGQPAAVNQAAPFDHFSWDLRGYTKSSEVSLSVEVTDALGLTGTSQPVAVQILVEGAPSGIQALFLRYGAMLVVLSVLVAAAVLLLAFVLAGRIQPKPLGSRRGKRSRYEDPVTQPVRLDEDGGRPPKLGRKKSSPRDSRPLVSKQRAITPRKAAAFLERLETTGELKAGSFIPIEGGEITIGGDAHRAQLHLDHPSIEPLHARLWQDSAGEFYLGDLKSTAGTWVNYTPVSASGSRLQNGDLIHLGTVGFRFRLKESEKDPRPIVIKKQN